MQDPPPPWGGTQEGKEARSPPFQIIIRRLYDPHSVIGIRNTQHIVDKTWRHWGEANIRKRTAVIHHQVCDV